MKILTFAFFVIVVGVFIIISGCDEANIVEPLFVTDDDIDNLPILKRDALLRNPLTVNFSIPETSHITLSIFEGNGSLVRLLEDKEFKPGYYEVIWDLKDDKGEEVDDGLYCISLTSQLFSKVMFIKIVT